MIAFANRGKWEQEIQNSLFRFSKPSRLTPWGQQDKTRWEMLNVAQKSERSTAGSLEGHFLSGQTLWLGQVLDRMAAWAQSEPLAVKGQVSTWWMHYPWALRHDWNSFAEKGTLPPSWLLKKYITKKIQFTVKNCKLKIKTFYSSQQFISGITLF